MNIFENILGAPAARRSKAFLFLFSHADEQEGVPSRGSAFPGSFPGAPQDFAGNSRAVGKEQASRLRSYSYPKTLK